MDENDWQRDFGCLAMTLEINRFQFDIHRQTLWLLPDDWQN